MVRMSPDAPDAPDAPLTGWTLVHRGSFVHGSCDRCGFVSPARRARFTTGSDMAAHALSCPEQAGAPKNCAGPGAPLGTGPLEAAEFGTRGCHDPTREPE